MKDEEYVQEHEYDQQYDRQPKQFKNETCPHCHQKRVFEDGLLRCKKCNNGDTPIEG